LRLTGEFLHLFSESLRLAGESLRLAGEFLHLSNESLRLAGEFLNLLGELLRFSSKIWGLIDQTWMCSIALARLGSAALCSGEIKILSPAIDSLPQMR
jgi:hypothetical protein